MAWHEADSGTVSQVASRKPAKAGGTSRASMSAAGTSFSISSTASVHACETGVPEHTVFSSLITGAGRLTKGAGRLSWSMTPGKGNKPWAWTEPLAAQITQEKRTKRRTRTIRKCPRDALVKCG